MATQIQPYSIGAVGKSAVRYPRVDLIGRTLGLWTVLSFAGRGTRKREAYWVCSCACGTTRSVCGSNIQPH